MHDLDVSLDKPAFVDGCDSVSRVVGNSGPLSEGSVGIASFSHDRFAFFAPDAGVVSPVFQLHARVGARFPQESNVLVVAQGANGDEWRLVPVGRRDEFAHHGEVSFQDGGAFRSEVHDLVFVRAVLERGHAHPAHPAPGRHALDHEVLRVVEENDMEHRRRSVVGQHVHEHARVHACALNGPGHALDSTRGLGLDEHVQGRHGAAQSDGGPCPIHLEEQALRRDGSRDRGHAKQCLDVAHPNHGPPERHVDVSHAGAGRRRDWARRVFGAFGRTVHHFGEKKGPSAWGPASHPQQNKKMPNYVTNQLVVVGPSPKSLRDFVKRHGHKARSDGWTLPNFGVAVPPPKGTEPMMSIASSQWFVDNWGVKWPANTPETSISTLRSAVKYAKKGRELRWFFTTPWSCPDKWFRAVRDMHPELTMTLVWFDTDDFPSSGRIESDGTEVGYDYKDAEAIPFIRQQFPEFRKFVDEREEDSSDSDDGTSDSDDSDRDDLDRLLAESQARLSAGSHDSAPSSDGVLRMLESSEPLPAAAAAAASSAADLRTVAPSLWGPVMWRVIHAVAPHVKRDNYDVAYRFIVALKEAMLCSECQSSFSKHLTELDPREYVVSGQFELWAYKMHALVVARVHGESTVVPSFPVVQRRSRAWGLSEQDVWFLASLWAVACSRHEGSVGRLAMFVPALVDFVKVADPASRFGFGKDTVEKWDALARKVRSPELRQAVLSKDRDGTASYAALTAVLISRDFRITSKQILDEFRRLSMAAFPDEWSS